MSFIKNTPIQSVKEVKVSLDFGQSAIPVGRLAVRKQHVYFEYEPSFIQHGFEISPLRLPLRPGLQSFDKNLFEGLPGVFNDSLPDGWGRLLFDRFARSQQISPAEITPLDRLAFVGAHALGALVYEPDVSAAANASPISLDTLAVQAQQVLQGEAPDVLAEMIALNGSSAGARPKALIGLNAESNQIVHGYRELAAEYTPWIVKFANTQDGADAGAIEYVYALMAKACGIDMPDVRLFPARHGPGYFAIRRFDRNGPTRYHMHTACGLLDSDFRTPSLDYEDLIALTALLTRDVREVEKMFRLAVFNVLAHNRDDHSKNFTFLMDANGQWRLSPAYDLTFSSGPAGEQSTTVMGEGRNPGIEQLLALAKEASIKPARAQDIIQQTQDSLSHWPELAKSHAVSDTNIALVKSKLIQ